MRELFRDSLYESAFEESDDFYDGWWTDVSGAHEVSRGLHFLSFTQGDTELVRATVMERADIADVFAEFDPSQPCLEIELIETNATMRKDGHGRRAVELIRRRWAQHQIVAFSLDADYFWSGVGFTEKARLDGGIGYSPLFVAPPSG